MTAEQKSPVQHLLDAASNARDVLVQIVPDLGHLLTNEVGFGHGSFIFGGCRLRMSVMVCQEEFSLSDPATRSAHPVDRFIDHEDVCAFDASSP